MTTQLTLETQRSVRIALKSAMIFETVDHTPALEALGTDLLNTVSLQDILATAGVCDNASDVLVSITHDPFGMRLRMCDATGMFDDGLGEAEHDLVIDRTIHHVNDRCIARVIREDTGVRTRYRLVLVQTDIDVALLD